MPRGALKTFMEILNGQVTSPGDCMLKQAVKMKRLQEGKEGSKIYLGFFFFLATLHGLQDPSSLTRHFSQW